MMLMSISLAFVLFGNWLCWLLLLSVPLLYHWMKATFVVEGYCRWWGEEQQLQEEEVGLSAAKRVHLRMIFSEEH